MSLAWRVLFSTSAFVYCSLVGFGENAGAGAYHEGGKNYQIFLYKDDSIEYSKSVFRSSFTKHAFFLSIKNCIEILLFHF